MATYGMQWAAPSLTASRKLRTKAMQCLWGKSGKLRCVEVVIGILQDPTKVDHAFAASYRSILDARRMILKSPQRQMDFLDNVMVYCKNASTSTTVGPVHGFLMHLSMIGSDLESENGDIIICTPLGARVILLKHALTHVQTCIREAC